MNAAANLIDDLCKRLVFLTTDPPRYYYVYYVQPTYGIQRVDPRDEELSDRRLSLKTSDTSSGTIMETQDASGSEECPFCLIVNNQGDTEVLLSDDELLCFRDVKPGASHHYLVIPRTHIDSCKSLQGQHIPLVERMAEMGRSILEKNKVSLDDIRMGFHVPPFSSVPHLHLHVLAPVSGMTFKSQLRYGPQSHWFITVNKVLSQLKTRGKVK